MVQEPPLPEKIGRYPVVRLLGRGAMGSVYLARDTELDREVAVKTVRMLGSSDDQEAFLVRFRNEARAVGRLRHPSIIAVYDVGNDPAAGPYLVFEYVEGANLKEFLRTKGPLAPEQVVALAEQVGGALAAAHREGIIHRDIKPENLLVGKDGMIRLADFGVARVPDAALTGEGQFLGTPCYGAPETLRSGLSGPLSDQFSFAAVLYEAASGVRVFPGQDAVAVAHRVIHEQPKPPSHVAKRGAVVPPALDAVILRGLAKEPNQRFPNLSQLIAELRRAYGLSPLSGGSVAGAVADTVPALRAEGISRDSVSRPAATRKLLVWPFVGALVLGGLVVMQLSPSTPAVVAPAPGGQGDVTPTKPVLGSKGVGQAVAVDASVPNVSTEAAATGQAPGEADTLSGLSAFEREERAKDALERAQRALDSGDTTQARAALDEASQYDPGHPDIEALRRRL